MENTGTAAGIGREDAGFYPGTEDSAAEIGREDAGRTDERFELRVRPENEPMNGTAGLVSLDELAAQMRIYSDGARGDYQHMMMNLLQFGRVMLEAKGRVGHGRWQSWVEENSGFSLRTAESYMQAYQKFGLNPDISKLGKSKALQMLPVPEDVREKVLAEHDVEHMSVREFKKLLKDETEKAAAEARAKAWAEAGERMAEAREDALAHAKDEAEKSMDAERARILQDAERKFSGERAEMEKKFFEMEKNFSGEREEMEKRFSGELEAAEKRYSGEKEALAREIEAARNSVPDELKAALEDKDRKIQEQKEEIQRLAAQAKETMEALKDGTGNLQAENSALRQEMREQEELLREQQDALNQAQEELLNLKSAQARGEEHVYSDELTLDTFERAVREFIGVCARMPHMGATFSTMDNTTLNRYFQLVKTVESWADGARNAIATVNVGGGIVVD